MPADVSIRRFKGLVTDTPNTEGEVDELIQAENVIFAHDGQLEARPGLHFFTNAPVGDTVLYFLGVKTDVFSPKALFAGDSAYYLWDYEKTTPSIPKTGVISVVSGSRTSN